ncbi:MAG: endonuclease domain-containing protein [Rhodospirillales bacterium]
MTDRKTLHLNARELRHDMSAAERRLWHYLRRRKLGRFRFRRQHPVPPWIADFACLEAGLLIEIDGETHIDMEKDARRDRMNAAKGFRTLRFSNQEIMRDVRGVLEVILRALREP